MIDSHIHIGQYNEIYYNPVEIIQIVMEKCKEGLYFSSTTTCKENIHYSEVELEIEHTLSQVLEMGELIRPFLWYIPAYIGQGVIFEDAIKNLPYKGIKLHPLAHQWDLKDDKILHTLHRIFEYAGYNELPVLIHTGNSGVDAASTFSQFFLIYPQTQFVLAHCRPLEEACSLIRIYPNVYGDTAFLTESDFSHIMAAGLGSKMIFGSDFPITHYFSNKYQTGVKKVSLETQYHDDFEQLQRMMIAA